MSRRGRRGTALGADRGLAAVRSDDRGPAHMPRALRPKLGPPPDGSWIGSSTTRLNREPTPSYAGNGRAGRSLTARGGGSLWIERALAGQLLAPIPLSLPGLARGIILADDSGEQGVAPQVVMVVEVLVAQGQAVDPLGDEIGEGVLDEVGLAVVGEAGGELTDDGGELLGLAEQQGAAVGG